MEHFPQHSQKGVCNKIFTPKETCPSTLNLYIVLQHLYEGWLILHVCQYVFQNHFKSRKIYMYSYADIIIHIIS